MADFTKADRITRQHEKGYAFNPNDDGGETWNGIARRYHSLWAGWNIIDGLIDKTDIDSKTEAKLRNLEHEFYKSQFWLPINGDNIPDQDIANVLYDIGVNFGVKRANRYLQKSLNVFNRNQKDYEDVSVDGAFGAKTLNSLNAYLKKRSKYVIIDAIATYAKHHWLEKAEIKTSQEVFLNGIFNRWEANARNLIKNYFKGEA